MTTDLELNLSSSLHYMQVKLLLLDSDFACGGNMHVDVTYSWFVCVCVCVRKNEMLFKWLYKVSNEYGLGDSAVKKLPAVLGILVQSPGWEDLLEEGMAINSNILVWKIPWREEPGELQSERSSYDLVTKLPPPLEWKIIVGNPKLFPQSHFWDSENIKKTVYKNHCKFKEATGIIFRKGETNIVWKRAFTSSVMHGVWEADSHRILAWFALLNIYIIS